MSTSAGRRSTSRGRHMTSVSTKPMSAARRKTLATQQITNVAGSNQTLAVTAALEVIAERLAWDPNVQQSLREKYAELLELSQPKPRGSTGSVPKPKGTLGLGEFSSLGKLDPYVLSRNYEPWELRQVLGSATAARLKQAIEVVQEHEPGTAPKNRTKKADMIDYIVEHVVGPGY
jgi:hypothetical protein